MAENLVAKLSPATPSLEPFKGPFKANNDGLILDAQAEIGRLRAIIERLENGEAK